MLHALPPSMEHLVPLLPVNGNSFLSIFERSAMNRRRCRGGEEMQLMRKVNRISAPTAAAQRSKHEAGIQIKTAKPDQTFSSKPARKLQDMLVRSV